MSDTENSGKTASACGAPNLHWGLGRFIAHTRDQRARFLAGFSDTGCQLCLWISMIENIFVPWFSSRIQGHNEGIILVEQMLLLEWDWIQSFLSLGRLLLKFNEQKHKCKNPSGIDTNYIHLFLFILNNILLYKFWHIFKSYTFFFLFRNAFVSMAYAWETPYLDVQWDWWVSDGSKYNF